MISRKNPGEKIPIALFILMVSSYIVILIPQIKKLFVSDEVAFVRAAIGVATEGLPIYTGANNEVQYALWHPPLYVYLLGASFKMLGVHEWSARMLSVIFTLATLFIVYRFSKDISNSSTVTFCSCLLFLLNPLIVQGSMLIDIDNGILMFLLMLIIYVYYKIDRTKKINLFFLGILFGIALWAKFPTPPLIIIGILVFNLSNKNLKKGITESLIIGSTGVALFLGTWFVYARFFNLPFLMPFAHSSNYLNPGGTALNFLLTHLWGLKNIIFWANPFFILLVLLVTAKRAKRYVTTGQLDIHDLLLIIGLLIFFQYFFVGSYQTQDFPRYFIPMMPLFSIVIADFIYGFGRELEGKLLPVGLIFIILSIYILFVLGDPILIDRIIFETGSIYAIVTKTAQTFLLYLLPFAISYFFFKITRTKNAAVIAVFISLIALNVGLDISHLLADYSTGYFHGERGMDKAIEYSRSYVRPDDAIIARDDVAYYLSSKEYYYLPWDSKEFDKLVSNKNITYIIINKEGYFTSLKYASVFDRIDKDFEMKAQFGDFKIFKNTSG